MSSHLTADSWMDVLNDYEDGVVSGLSEINATDLCKSLFQACIISSENCDRFTSLDHSVLDHQLQKKVPP